MPAMAGSGCPRPVWWGRLRPLLQQRPLGPERVRLDVGLGLELGLGSVSLRALDAPSRGAAGAGCRGGTGGRPGSPGVRAAATSDGRRSRHAASASRPRSGRARPGGSRWRGAWAPRIRSPSRRDTCPASSGAPAWSRTTACSRAGPTPSTSTRVRSTAPARRRSVWRRWRHTRFRGSRLPAHRDLRRRAAVDAGDVRAGTIVGDRRARFRGAGARRQRGYAASVRHRALRNPRSARAHQPIVPPKPAPTTPPPRPLATRPRNPRTTTPPRSRRITTLPRSPRTTTRPRKRRVRTLRRNPRITTSLRSRRITIRRPCPHLHRRPAPPTPPHPAAHFGYPSAPPAPGGGTHFGGGSGSFGGGAHIGGGSGSFGGGAHLGGGGGGRRR